MDNILTKEEAAEKLKVSTRTLDYLIGSNQIPFSRVGKRAVRFLESRLESWLLEREGIDFRHKSHRPKKQA